MVSVEGRVGLFVDAQAHRLRTRHLLQCAACRAQTSLTSQTLFAGTKLPLTVWFLAIYRLSQAKNGIASLELARSLGVSANTAWLLRHKLMQAMLERDAQRPLSGAVQLDDAYWGGRRRGYKLGRGSRGKSSISEDEAGRKMLQCGLRTGVPYRGMLPG